MELVSIVNDAFQATKLGDAVELKNILTAHSRLVHLENSDGLTLLGYAGHFGDKEVVQVVLDFGAEVNALSHSTISFIPSNTALHAAIAGERNLDVIKLLLEHGADPNLLDSNGQTCLHVAAFHEDNQDIIRLLVEYGADASLKSEDGETALSIAAKQGNTRVVEWLQQNDK